MLKKILLTIWNVGLLACSAFIMSSAWHWVQMMHKPRLVVLKAIMPEATCLFLIFIVFYLVSLLILSKKNKERHKQFKKYWPEGTFVFSMIFLSVFGKEEWQCLIAFLAFSSFFVYYVHQLFRSFNKSEHARALLIKYWIFFVFFYCLIGIMQFLVHYYYILDVNYKFTKTIPLLRTIAIVLFLLSLVCTIFYVREKNKKIGKVALVLFAVIFGVYLFFSGVNIGILNGSGLFISPTAIQHAEGAGAVIFTPLSFVIFAVICLSLILTFILLKKNHVALLLSRNWLLLIISLWILTGLTWTATIKFVRMPGVDIAKAFYQYYNGETNEIVLPNEILEKLKNQFGLNYNPDAFYVSKKEKIFNKQADLLPKKFNEQKPNILVVFLESFSSKLSDVYNDAWEGKLTPALKEFSSDPNTTVFKKYYNSSTPTVTGLLSLICSFLPPTGHEEINRNDKLSRFYLSCLPDILEKHGGYQTISYITAVNKSYAHKDSLFQNAGVKDVYGTEELKKYIKEDTKAWGFSDHQMLKVLPEFLQKAESPFLIMLSTVDSHQQYNLAKDIIQFGDGKSDVLNAFHTTDDAFGKFFKWFKTSEFATNTILITVADHAAFPTAYKQVSQYADLEKQNKITYYDENVFMIRVPDSVLPKIVETYSSELDVTPTILHMLNINVPNTFEGHSIFDDRDQYPNLLGMHELGLYINQQTNTGAREELYQLPVNLSQTCVEETVSSTAGLTLCEFNQFYQWKRQMLEQGRLWMK